MKFVIFVIKLLIIDSVNGIYNISRENIFIAQNSLDVLSQLDDNYFKNVVKFSNENFDRIERLESNIVQARVTVKNGSLSHGIYLETFPNSQAKREDIIARKILASTLHILHSKCIQNNIPKQDCINYLRNVPLPESELREQCLNIARESNYHSFRRLLEQNYKDKLYSMNAKLPQPSKITNLNFNLNSENLTEDKKNLILVQWAQFIEHDLSKPVAASMKDGVAIECCNEDNYKLAPRHIHPVCAPLEGITMNAYGRTPCINYVRSAIAVNKQCNFGSVEPYNQATAVLDLSQVYGHTNEIKNKLRTGQNGEIKFSSTLSNRKSLLPTVEEKEKDIYCVLSSNPNDEDCFMAGDTRVNSNPFVTILYTIFLRSHNEMAKRLKTKNPNWSDETLYNEASKNNIKIYRNIVYKEWLPVVLGADIARLINNETLYAAGSREFGISNEFGVAAIRFYYSMLPDVLNPKSRNIYTGDNFIEQNVFALKDQYYKSDLLSNPDKLDIILNGMLQQKAMKMDSNYAESVTKHFLKAKSTIAVSGADAFAFDVQRGRDHGLQGYVKYLENCENIKINDWNDLNYYMKSDDIERLKSIYNDLMDIDLIVGGVSEKPKSGSTVGPTFTCILAEQFSNIRLLQFNLEKDATEPASNGESTYGAAKLMCETTNLVSVPINVFSTPSEINEMVSCDELLKKNNI